MIGSHIGGKYGPYIQSQRMDIYKKHANILLEVLVINYYYFRDSILFPFFTIHFFFTNKELEIRKNQHIVAFVIQRD